MQCPACRATVPDGARFCPSCGHGLVAAVDERRVATVLFADLVGFTGLAEGRDPEQTKQLVDRCFESLADDIRNHGGTVDKVLGDAIIAVFGAPMAHEDDAERAVRAGLQLRRSVALHADDAGLALQLRIGINTGEVLIGAMRAGGDTTAMGDAVNVASRLQTAAEPGQILVGPDTWAQTNSVIRFESVGPLAVRNRDEPVPAYAAIETVAPPGLRQRRTRTPFVGREHELAMLGSALYLGLQRRRPQFVLVVGEAGVGKSRLAEEAATRWSPDDTMVLDSRCAPYGETNVWWPLAEAIRQAMAVDGDPCDVTADQLYEASSLLADGTRDDAEIERIVEGVRYVLGDADALSQVDPAKARGEALRSALVVLEELARHKPVILGISELHWADEVVLEFIDRALARVGGLPLVILATARPELLSRWQPTGGRHGIIGLHLEPFTDDEARALLDAIFEGTASEELTTTLLARSGSNPLFLEELALLVRDAGPARDLPVTLRALVATRLDALARSARRVLDDAAVIGRVGSVEAIVALGPSDVQAADSLAELAAQDLLDVEGRRWTFRSDVVREVAYETLSKAERARRHAALVEWLERSEADDGADLDQVAFHAASAADLVQELGSVDGVPIDITERAVMAIECAADRALDRESAAEALRLYDRGIHLIRGSADSPARLRFLAGRGRANTLLRHSEQARVDLDASLAASRQASDRVAEAKALTALAQLAQSDGELAVAEAQLSTALGLWRQLSDPSGEARVLRLQATLFLIMGRAGEAAVAIDHALQLFEELGDRRGLAWAQQQLGWIAFTFGDVDTADVHLGESIAAFTEMNDYAGLAWALGVQAWVRLQQGHIAEAEDLADFVLARGETDVWAAGMLTMLLATTRLWTGRTEEALELARSAQERFAAINDRTGQLRSLGVLLRAMVAGGRAQEALETMQRYKSLAGTEVDEGSRRLARSVGVGLLSAAGLGQRALDLADAEPDMPIGLALVMVGEVETALERLRVDYEAARGPGRIPDAGSAYAIALVVAGRPDEARAVVEEVRAQATGTYHDQVLLHIAAGLAATQLGEGGVARHELDGGVAVADATGDRLSQTIARLARGHSGVGEAGDLDDARWRLAEMNLGGSDWNTMFRSASAWKS